MKQFIGTKLVNATPLNRHDYNDMRGWDLPADEDGTDEGYLVEYVDGGQANVEGFAGYISWSPTEVFENSYKESGSLSFGDAIIMARRGHCVARTGWNGAGMFAYIVPANKYSTDGNPTSPLVGMFPDNMVPYREYWALKTAQDDVAMWAPSGSDSLANDWGIADLGIKVDSFYGRLCNEKEELQIKFLDLTDFIGANGQVNIFSKLTGQEQKLLRDQRGLMGAYLSTLQDRIKIIEDKDQDIEKQIQDKGLTAPRVTPDQIDALMDDVNVHCYVVPGTTTTVAVAFLSNGFTLGAEISACASPENFDKAIGFSIARDKVLATARDKLWEMEGYALKKTL